MGWEPLLLAAMGGMLIGFLLTLFGGGGSVLATPWLVYVVGLADTHAAIGTSAAAVAVNAATGLAAQARAGRQQAKPLPEGLAGQRLAAATEEQGP